MAAAPSGPVAASSRAKRHAATIAAISAGSASQFRLIAGGADGSADRSRTAPSLRGPT